MKVTQEVINLIQEDEHCALHAYQDSGGVWTIGLGHTGPEVVEGLIWTKEQAYAAFLVDLNTFAHQVLNTIHQTLSNDQFSALVSLVYNIGIGRFRTSKVFEALEKQDFPSAANAFLLYDHDRHGTKLAGLDKRRAQEKAIFLRNEQPTIIPAKKS